MVFLTDVTLRDGLQMEAVAISTEKKVKLANLLVQCRYSRYEIASFVNPKWVPQFSDSAQFCEKFFDAAPSGEWMAFVPNLKGAERALKYPISWLSTFVAATESFNRKNVNCSRAETLSGISAVLDASRKHGRKVRVYVSTVFGCPYEGVPDRVELGKLLSQVIALNPDEIAISDTLGVATPDKVEGVLRDFLSLWPALKTACHFHNTYGLALAASQAAYQLGVRNFDGSTAGLGGCPYAQGATGNVPTEDLAYLWFRQRQYPGFQPKAIRSAGDFLSLDLKLKVQGSVMPLLRSGVSLFGEVNGG